jgi:hypothetical protein
MTHLAQERYISTVGTEFGLPTLQIGVDAGAAKIWKGAMVSSLTATGMAVRATTAASSPVKGVATMTVDASAGGSDGDYSINLAQGCFYFNNGTAGDACSEATIGNLVYAADDNTVYDNSAGSTLPVAGICMGYNATTDQVLVLINAALNRYLASSDAATLTSLLASIANAEGASLIGVEDAGAYTSAANVETVLTELLRHMRSTQKQIHVPITQFVDADGDPIVKFVNGASTIPGHALADSKALGVRWNNDANPGVILGSVMLPSDLDDTANVVMHIMASKTGATLGDAVTFLVAAYCQTVGALHDADANLGGTSSAMTGDATAKTVQELTLTLAAADIPAHPANLTFTIKPTDGTLGTDDVIIEAIWLEYKGKALNP